jgi:UDP-N-acetyl-D-galactosamine dehydrogenase
MGKWIVSETVKKMIQLGKNPRGSNVLILGVTFKENVPDVRNSRVEDIYKELKDYGANVTVVDPMADPEEVLHEYGIELGKLKEVKDVDVVIAAVAHDEYRKFNLDGFVSFLTKKKPLIIDIKGIYKKDECTKAGFEYWRL